MSEELILTYNHKKMYFRFGVTAVSLLLVIYAFTTIREWSLYTIVLFMGIIVGTIAYIIFTYKKMKRLSYFLKCNDTGIYTKECFTFCSWDNIKKIELKRYMGYQTLFFEVYEANLESKMSAIHKGNWIYYCLPLADCKGKARDNYMNVLNFYIKHKKN